MPVPLINPVRCPVLIGRAADLDALWALAAASKSGHGQTALIAGEAGVGKSRLAEEVASGAAADGFLVLRGHCAEGDVSSPYAPLLDLLRSQFARAAVPARAADLDPITAELMRLLPGIMPPPTDLVAEAAPDLEARKQRLFAALLHHIARVAARQPLVLLVEDLHWSDDNSLEFLTHLARFSITRPVLVLLTYRGDDARPPLEHWLAEFERERLAREFTLDRLRRDEVAAMLRAIFGLGGPIRAEFLDAIFELTGGNPFFIEEVLKALISAGDIFYGVSGWDRKPVDQLRIPRSVQDAVWRRVERLGPAARRVVALAAVVGQRFEFALLRELAELTGGALVEAIKELRDAQLVVEESSDHFAFRHALTRQAIGTALLARERRDLHGRIADILERSDAADPDRFLPDLAYHCAAAEAWDKALNYARRAAEQARALYAPRAVIAQVTRALAAAHNLALAPDPQAYRMRGAAYDTIGDFDAARADYETALRLAEDTGDRQMGWRMLLDLGSLYAGRDYARTGAYFTRALDRARADGDRAMIARSLNRLGNWHLNAGDPSAALPFHREALGLFEALDDQPGRAETLDLLGMTFNIGGDPLQSSHYYAGAIAVFRALDDRHGLVNSLVIHLLQSGSYWHDTLVAAAMSPEEALRAGESALDMVRALGWPAGEAYVRYELALWLGPRGEFARALELAHTGLAIATEIGHQQWIIGCHAALGALHLDLLAPSVAREHLERALALARAIGSRVWLGIVSGLFAEVCVALRQLPGADAALNTSMAASTPTRTLDERMLWRARAELALASGEAAEALRIVESLIASDPNASATAIVPRLWKLRGEALAALGRLDEAEAALLAACAAARQLGARPLLWRIHLAFAELLRAERRHAEAGQELAAARSVVAALFPLIPEGSSREDFVRLARERIPRPHESTRGVRRAPDALTPREREVARLIAAGKSNGEIAGALVLGKRTVETHISHILAKQGFQRRAQIVAWALAPDTPLDTPLGAG